MKTYSISCIICGIIFSMLGCKEPKKQQMVKGQSPALNTAVAVNDFTVHVPKTYENLSVYMITGKAGIRGESYMTLSQAMKEKQVRVIETGAVNELAIDNLSDDYVFIHSGDIVKGGKQDRTISYDVIIPPNAINVSLESFCVEQGRWKQRADEQVLSFASNSKMLSSRDLKLAAKYEKNQTKVWSKVAEQKTELDKALSHKNGFAVTVEDTLSNTSLQLALENEVLKKDKKEYLNALKEAINIEGAVGYAYAINGEIYGVELYNNTQLFVQLWDKIIGSIVVEAISKYKNETIVQPKVNDVATFMKAVTKEDKMSLKRINDITHLKTLESKTGHIVFITEDLHQKTWIHKSYMKQDTSEIATNTRQKFSVNSLDD